VDSFPDCFNLWLGSTGFLIAADLSFFPMLRSSSKEIQIAYSCANLLEAASDSSRDCFVLSLI
jgi:hypothetical protein